MLSAVSDVKHEEQIEEHVLSLHSVARFAKSA
jgi:hypothetical protein